MKMFNRGFSTESAYRAGLRRRVAWVAAGVPISGLIATSAGVLVASGSPILDGFGRGPARGMVIIGRFLNNTELLRLGNQAQVKLDMRVWSRPSAADSKTATKVWAGEVRLTESATTTRIERVFADLSGEPLLVFGIGVPRTIGVAPLVRTDFLAG